jgi:hypothetical protein
MPDLSVCIPLAELADERQVSVSTLRHLCAVAKVRIPTSERLAPSAWKKLDAYVYKHYKVAAGQPLPRLL